MQTKDNALREDKQRIAQWKYFQNWFKESYTKKTLKTLEHVFFGEKISLEEPALVGLYEKAFRYDYEFYASEILFLRPIQNVTAWNEFFDAELKQFCEPRGKKYTKVNFNKFARLSLKDLYGWDAKTHLAYWHYFWGETFDGLDKLAEGKPALKAIPADELFVEWSVRIHQWYSRSRIFQRRYLIPDDNIYILLKDYILSSISHFPDNAFEPYSEKNESLLALQFHNILAYANNPEAYYVQHKSTIKEDPKPLGEARKAFFAQLKNDFDNKDLGEPFARLWNQVKSNEIAIPDFY